MTFCTSVSLIWFMNVSLQKNELAFLASERESITGIVSVFCCFIVIIVVVFGFVVGVESGFSWDIVLEKFTSFYLQPRICASWRCFVSWSCLCVLMCSSLLTYMIELCVLWAFCV